MTPSLILSLVSSFLSLPLVSLQSLVAWQYNKIGGFGEQKTVLHNVCTYVLRLSLMLWLATCVSGLVVAAQQVYCLPSGTHATFWRVGTSCAFHRASVIVSVVTLVTVVTMYCARELCDRPYDVSLIGIYKRSQALRDGNGSIFSGYSWDSEETLKNEILNLCRQHDGKSGGEPWSNDPLADKINCHPSIRHPAPVRLRPQLRVNTDPGSEYGEVTSGTTASPDDTLPRVSPGGTVASDFFYPISRTSTVMTSQTACESRMLIPDTSVPKVPAIPEQYTKHKRGKSSLSSLRRFLPKSFPLSLPLSSDPQIRALADPNAASDVEKQVVTPSTTTESSQATKTEVVTTQRSEPSNRSTKTAGNADSTKQTVPKPDGNGRTFTMNSADAPEVVPDSLPSEPPKVCRSQTASLATPTRSINHPHHPDHTQGPRRYSLSCRQNSTGLPQTVEPIRRPKSRQSLIVQYPVRSATYQFDKSHPPHHKQSPYHPQYYSQPTPLPSPTRWGSQRSFSPTHIIHTVPRRNDVEVIYPSTRRPRSSTHGNFSGPLSCIMESASSPRASVDGSQFAIGDTQRNVLDQNTYRGTNRTSMSFY
ncbi:hypothetical protein N7512_003189 [Penicillium capsulatum]|nr:hypothetical protein N7512_003189 [Penicillium capsulatum]